MSDVNTPVPHVNPWLIAVAVMFGTFMEVLDTTVVNVSLPHIAGSLSVTTEEATWALTSYLVANAIVLPITGWLANYFGRKRLLMSATVGFTSASFLCGFAPIVMPKLFIFDPHDIRRTGAKVDAWGIWMLAVGIGSLQFVLDKGQQEDWFASNRIAALTFVSAAALIIFIVHEFRIAHPVI